MIALDTNVIVRFLARDDERQARIVYDRLKQAELARESLFVPMAVLLETIWVLGSAYGKSRDDILGAIEQMRRMPIFEFEKDEAVERLVSEGKRSKADLADILIAHSAECDGCELGLTFDKNAAGLKPQGRILNPAKLVASLKK